MTKKSKKARKVQAPAQPQALAEPQAPARPQTLPPPQAKPQLQAEPEPRPRVFGPTEGHAAVLPRSRSTRWIVLTAIALTWLTGFGARAIWLSNNENNPAGANYEDHRLLTTADAYFYASGVKSELTGFLAKNPRVPDAMENVVVLIGVGIVKVLGVSVEDVAVWLPAFLAPLVAIPLILLGLMLNQLLWGILAALISVFGFSYWNRTVPGYFDTDMVSIPFVLAVGVLLVAAIWRRRPLFGVIAGVMTVAAPYMHPGSERVLAAVALATFGYALVFDRKETRAYRVAVSMLIAFLPLPWFVRPPLIVAVDVVLARVKLPLLAVVGTAATMFVVVLLTSRSMDLVFSAIGIRIPDLGGSGGRGGVGGPSLGVKFPGIGDTVAELTNPTVQKLGERVAGHTTLLIVGALGYLAACWRYRPLLILTPFLALGTVAATTGQRFTIFAVPIVALGNIWLLYTVGRIVVWLLHAFAQFKARFHRVTELVIMALLSPIALAPAVAHSFEYPARVAIIAGEAQQLIDLGKRVKPGDFIFTWWDYSYAAWYHAGVNTFIDGSKQNADLWIATEALYCPDQREAASLARFATELQVTHEPMEAFVSEMLLDWRDTTKRPVTEFIPALRAGQVPLPAKTREVYFYIPWRILQISPNVSRQRLAKGLVPEDELKQSSFLVMNPMNADGTQTPRSGWSYDAATKMLVSAKGERAKVGKVVDVTTDSSGRVRSRETDALPDGRLVVMNLRHVNLVLFMDRSIYTSVLSQLLFLGKPDPRYFELVSYTRAGVIYRVLL